VRAIVLAASCVMGLVAQAAADPPKQESKAQSAPAGFADIVSRVAPAVVSVRVTFGAGSVAEDGSGPLHDFLHNFRIPGLRNNPHARPTTPVVTGLGSGFFVSSDGYLVTNNHVVKEAQSIEVTLADGKKLKPQVVGTDARTDLALLKVSGGPYSFLQFSDAEPRVGDWVLALGDPFGLGGTVTAGIVSARGRDLNDNPYQNYIQIDAPVNKGNSGGPTVDTKGEVVGVNTAIYSPSGGSVGIAFDIPAATVKTVVAQLKEHGRVIRGWLGAEIENVTPEVAGKLGLQKPTGALIAAVEPDSPAAKGGLKPGDVVTQLNDQPIEHSRDLAQKIGAMQPGTKANLTVIDHRSKKVAAVTLTEKPPAQAKPASATTGRGSTR